jgi:hypothetical protein
MLRPALAAACLAVCLSAAAPLAPVAAQRTPGSRTLDDRVYVVAQVMLSDTTDSYDAVVNLPLVLHGGPGDSVAFRTDASGTGTIAVAPGQYRLVVRAA